WDALLLLGCLLAAPSSRGISTPSPVTMAATPEMIPGTVVQKFLFSAAMRHLLSHPDRGDRVGVVQRQPQRKLRASGRAVCPQRPGRVKAKPRLPTPPGRDLRRLGQRNGELFAPIGAIASPGLKPCPGR